MNILHFDRLFVILVSLIPLTILAGSAISLINILLLCIHSLIVIVILNKHKIFYNKAIISLLIIYLYFFLNSFIAIDFNNSLLRNLGFIRYILLFIGINYLFLKFKERIFLKSWLIIIFIVVLDSYLEIITGNNSFGFGNDPKLFGRRIVSFFKDEPVVGAYINAFYLLMVGYLFMSYKNYSKVQKITVLFLSVFIVVCIALTGERANSLRAIIGTSIFFSLNKEFKIKSKLLIFLSLFIIILTSLSQSSYLKERYGLDAWYDDKRISSFKNNTYFLVYSSAFEVFKEYPLLGVGNKNYRVEACKPKNLKKGTSICTTHPHQIYLEFLSEHGIIGSLVLLSIFYFLIIKILRVIMSSKERNYLQLGTFIYVGLTFFPFLPTGAFFSDFNANLFWINFSVMYACNQETNIFYQKLKIKDKIN